MITAEHVNAAIVRACKATGENVADVVEKKHGQRARHYALHALLHVFINLPEQDAAALVGCWGTPRQFYDNSYAQTFKMRPDGKRRASKWFDDTVFADVIAAIRAVVITEDTVAVAAEPGRKPRRESRRQPRRVVAVSTVAKNVQPQTIVALEQVARRVSLALSIDMSKREPKPVKPPRIEYIPGVQPKHFEDGIPRDARYDAVAYKPKGQIVRNGSKADLYEQLRQAVLNTPGSKDSKTRARKPRVNWR